MDRTEEIYAWLICKFASVISETEVCRVDDIFFVLHEQESDQGWQKSNCSKNSQGPV